MLEAIEQFVRFARITVDDVDASFEWRQGMGVLRLGLGAGDPESERHPREYLSGLIVTDFSESSRGRFRPHVVRFPHAPAGDQREYETILRCPVRFRCPELEVVVTEEMLSTRLGTQSPEVAVLLEEAARRELAMVTSEDLLPRVSVALGKALSCGADASAYSIATQLGLSVRTLQRRLGEEGSSFRLAWDEARCRPRPRASLGAVGQRLPGGGRARLRGRRGLQQGLPALDRRAAERGAAKAAGLARTLPEAVPDPHGAQPERPVAARRR